MDAETQAVWRTVELEMKAAAKDLPELESDRQSAQIRLAAALLANASASCERKPGVDTE